MKCGAEQLPDRATDAALPRIEEHDGVLRLCGLSPYNCQVLHASPPGRAIAPLPGSPGGGHGLPASTATA